MAGEGHEIGRWGQDSNVWGLKIGELKDALAHRPFFVIAGLTSTGIADVINTPPGATAYGVVARIAGTVNTAPSGSAGTQDVVVLNSVGVSALQAGTWTIQQGSPPWSVIINGQPISVDLKNVSVTSAGGLTTLAQSTSAGGLVRLATDFGAIFARMKNRQYMDNEEVRYDTPTLLANSQSFVGLSSSGAATASNAWHVIRTDYDDNGNPNRDRIRFSSWDNRNVGWV